MMMVRKHIESRFQARINRRTGRGLLVGLVLLSFLIPVVADATDPGELRAQKLYWQTRYRDLRTRADELRATIDLARGLYASANRRNYRRGGQRHIQAEVMKAAASELEEVDAALASIEDDGRRAGALPGWFYEVERAAGEQGPEISAGPGDEGRNPLYLKGPRSEK
jgi:hypothetical protein